MIEVKLNQAVESQNEVRKKLYAIVNEKGLYLKKTRPYWTSDLNKCLSEIRSENCQIDHVRYLLKIRAEYDEKKSVCCNTDLFYGFEKLFIQEVNITPVN